MRANANLGRSIMCILSKLNFCKSVQAQHLKETNYKKTTNETQMKWHINEIAMAQGPKQREINKVEMG